MAAITSSAMTSATTKMYVSAATPATYDAAGFAALAWTFISEVNNIGSIGGTTSVQKHMPLDSGVTVKVAGSVDYGTADVTLAKHSGTDTNLLKTAFAARSPVSVKIVYPTALGLTTYFTGIVTTNVTTIGTSDTILELKATIDVTNEVLEF